MYDVDGNGVIDVQEMTKIVQVGAAVWLVRMIYSEKIRKAWWSVACFVTTLAGWCLSLLSLN